MASKTLGIREFRAALKRLPEDMRREVFEAVSKTAKGVHQKGRANIASMTTKRSGDLSRLYRVGLSRKALSARVGYLSEKSRGAAFYARFINDGTSKMQARPFHTNAVESERELDTQRMVRARDDALRRVLR